jgi:hypothetical protein
MKCLECQIREALDESNYCSECQSQTAMPKWNDKMERKGYDTDIWPRTPDGEDEKPS